ncbi:hypothetical protein L3Q82_010879 [Scortum barcoo]|uniref:Uncharacterized protein n=1 Tax=Scortum barcoo TaxID=214431 RepID=A0ACB8W8Q4_9TELE|nr:hypothetical protein L3Q82_010879 [Scortum barcoo]
MDEDHAGIAASPRPGSSVSSAAAERRGHCRVLYLPCSCVMSRCLLYPARLFLPVFPRQFQGRFGEPEIQKKLKGATRTKLVFVELQREMATVGYDRNIEQINNKLKKLKKEFRDQKRELGRSGAGRPRKSPHFDLLDLVLCDRLACQLTGDPELRNSDCSRIWWMIPFKVPQILSCLPSKTLMVPTKGFRHHGTAAHPHHPPRRHRQPDEMNFGRLTIPEVVVEYEYDALHDDELTLRLGDIIKNVRYIEEDGWMEGDLNGKRGLFPDNFVKELKKESKEVKETKNEPKEETSQAPRREKSAGNVANLVQRMSTIGFPTGGFQPQPPAASKKPKKRQCKVLFEYQPLNEDELELKVGDIIDITEEVEEGWWSGNLNGKSGLFPSNFVKELDATGEDGEANDATADEADGSGMESTATPTSPQSASGNGVIAQPKKIRGVGFGDIFREGSVKLKVRLPSPETAERKEKPIPSLPSAAKPAPHPNMTDSQRADGDSKSKVKEYCKVTFGFEATNEDELSLKEGDIIHILSKDTGEPGWWRGEIGGKEGVFPDNFVTMLPEAEKEPFCLSESLEDSHVERVSEIIAQAGTRGETQEATSTIKKHRSDRRGDSLLIMFRFSALKPEVPSADKKPHPVRSEDRVDRPTPDHKPSKPAAPVVPPKKPVPPPGKGRPVGLPPKRPDKPLAPSPNLKHNGEVPSTRPKSDFEPSLPTKPKTLSGDWGEKSSDMDLMSFDELSSTSEKLSHPTANRPKMPGRRLPAQFGGGHSPNKEVNVEKSFKMDEEDAAKPKLTETRKPSTNTLSQLAAQHKPTMANAEAKPSPVAPPSSDSVTQGSRARLEPEEPSSQLDELRNQMKELLLSVELIKAQQMREIAELRGELDEERLKRVALQRLPLVISQIMKIQTNRSLNVAV